MRERKSEKELVIRIIITGADAEEPDEPEYWTEEEEGVLNELVAYTETVAGQSPAKQRKSSMNAFSCTQCALQSACMATNTFQKQLSFSQIS